MIGNLFDDSSIIRLRALTMDTNLTMSDGIFVSSHHIIKFHHFHVYLNTNMYTTSCCPRFSYV